MSFPASTRLTAAILALAAVAIGASAPSGSPATKPEDAPAVRGRIVAPDGVPVKRAVVLAYPEADARGSDRGRRGAAAPAVRIDAGEDGTFEVRGLRGASYGVRILSEGWAPFTQTGVPDGAALEVVLRRGHALSGVVLDVSARRPLAGATVLGCDPDAAPFGDEACRAAKSGDDGTFTLADLPRGSVTLAVRAAGYAAARLEGPAVPATPPKEGERANLVEVYLRAGGRLAGRAVGGDGAPVSAASLSVQPLDGFMVDLLREFAARPVRSDASGAFAFEGLPPGRYRIHAAAEGMADAEAGPFEVRAGTDRTDLEIRLDAGAALKVRVVDRDQKPVRGLGVELSTAGERPRGGLRSGGEEVDDRQIREGENGSYTVTRLEPGTYTVRLLPDDREEVEKENVTLRNGDTVDLGTIVVREGRSVSGRITDAASSPIPGAEVIAVWSTADGKMKTRRVRSKEDGRYRMPAVGEEPFDLIRVRAAGFSRGERRGAVPGDRTVDFVLEKTGSVAGRVLTGAGSAPAAFRVRTHAEATSDADSGVIRMLLRNRTDDRVFTDPSGNFRVDDVEPGTYTVEAIADRFAPAKRAGVRVVSDQVADAGTLTLREGAALRGRVVDARDDSPVAGAGVRVELPSALPLRQDRSAARAAVSAGDGAFTVTGLETGAYEVAAEHPDFSPSRVRVEIPADRDPADLVVELSKGGTLTGTVRDSRRQPQADARMVVYQGMGPDPRSVTTGPDGTYVLERLAPGSYRVMRIPGERALLMGSASKTAVVREGETTVLDFDDAPKVLARGRVLRGSEPLPGVTLFFSHSDSANLGDSRSGQADGEGRYEVGLDRGGRYRVSVQDGGLGRFRGRRTIAVEVPEQAEASVDVVLSVNALAGWVSSSEGTPVTGAVVTARAEAADATPGSTVTATSEADGSFRLDGLDPGKYQVSLRAQGYRSPEAQAVDVADGVAPEPLEFRLERGRLLRGRVVDPSGGALAGAMIFVAPSGGDGAVAGGGMNRTDVNGVFVTTAPSEGPIDITAIPAGWAPAVRIGVLPPEDDGEELVLRAGSGGTIRVRVLGPEGEPMAGVQVAIRAAAPFPGAGIAIGSRRPDPTGLDGCTSLDLLAPGAYVVVVPERPPLHGEVIEGTVTELRSVPSGPSIGGEGAPRR